MQKLLDRFTDHPQQLLIVDAFGALLSAVLLGLVLPAFQEFFGMPREALYWLAGIPCLFVGYDLTCAFILKTNPAACLKGIALANLGYCLVSLGFLIHHAEGLTVWGWAYFSGEILLVMGLAAFELKVAKGIS